MPRAPRRHGIVARPPGQPRALGTNIIVKPGEGGPASCFAESGVQAGKAGGELGRRACTNQLRTGPPT
ncbi:hypothetical protein BDY21DRAFT_347024 [Lineolata rhizophorae]|uniref:Uncharacterized protein n=1 Tax=Lineolata rhizophorae TaxID=578093 RepID=A0A6A6NXD8_9PEZI|nr:hypothetical protein BDY21DRAFT_347024 [Lineolata rhizophorae]